jgi:hypothetical protein
VVDGIGESPFSEHRNEFLPRGEVGDAPRQVAVGGPVGEQSADERDDPTEVDRVAEAHERVVGNADVEEGDATARPDDPGRLGEERSEVDQIAKCETAGEAVDGRGADGKLEDVGLGARGSGSVGGEHAVAEIHGDGTEPGLGEIDAEIPGARGEIEHGGPGRKGEIADRPSAPPDVEAEGHDPIDEVVSRRDRVEHLADGALFLGALRERVSVPERRAVGGSAGFRHAGRLGRPGSQRPPLSDDNGP